LGSESQMPNINLIARHGTMWRGDWIAGFSWIRRDGAFAALPGGPLLDLSFDRVVPHHVMTGFRGWEYGGPVQAGLVVACESAREIVGLTIERLLREKSMDVLRKTIATLTGGSGAVAVLLTDASLAPAGHRLIGGVARSAPEHHRLCTWGPDTGIPGGTGHMAETDSAKVLQNGVALGIETFREFRKALALGPQKPDKIICHQVGATHQRTILDAIGMPPERDFTTFRYLGNIGTVSLPITAAIAEERGFLSPGDLVGLLGIGSGLNCLMLGVNW
jgi:3-oxoacyl-[acyl-carrier-protein] synthase-3